MGSYQALFYEYLWQGLSTPFTVSELDPPKIEFPCPDYPIKIIGLTHPEFKEVVLNVVERHAPGFDATRIQINVSGQGNYQSLTLWITATGPEQLSELNRELRINELVKLVL